MLHKIKILEQYADAVAEGRKNFEVRYNDRGYNAGDIVEFHVIDDLGIEAFNHPLNEKRKEITYVHSGLGLKYEYVVFGLGEVKDDKGRSD